VQPNRFSHDYFVAQSFDNVKVLPPSTPEELEKAIKDLEDKIEYYLTHPEENVEQKFAKDKQYLDKAGSNADAYKPKNTKARGGRNIINT
jgi:hypothetical protein